MILGSLRSWLIHRFRDVLGLIYARRLRHHPELRQLLERYRASESAAIDVSDAIALYELVLERRPNCLLDLGPGTSTAVFALAIKKLAEEDASYKPVFVAIEESEDWLAYHEKLFPPELRGFVELILSPVELTEFAGTGATHYAHIPQHPYDLIHVDGPSVLEHGVRVTCDLLEIAPNLATGWIAVFDARTESVRFTAKQLAGSKTRRHFYTLNYELWV